MSDPISLTAYAKLRGVSVMAVSKAVSSRRLDKSVVRDQRGAPKISDPDLADREWSANTRHQAGYTAPEQPVATALVDGPPVATQETHPPGGVPDYNTSRALRAAAAARREAHLADMAELELAAKRGRLVDADEARADVFARVSMAKTRIMAVPTLVAQDAPDLAARVVPLIERRIREALEELSLDDRGA